MRKRFSEEFKSAAIRLVRDVGLSLAKVAKDVGVGESMLSKWLAASSNTTEAVLNISEREELKQLRKENAQLKLEREILKKASAYFAKQYL